MIWRSLSVCLRATPTVDHIAWSSGPVVMPGHILDTFNWGIFEGSSPRDPIGLPLIYAGGLCFSALSRIFLSAATRRSTPNTSASRTR